MRAVGEHCFAIQCVYLAGHGEGGAEEGSKAHGVGRVYVVQYSRERVHVWGMEEETDRSSCRRASSWLAVAQGVAQRADYSAGSRGSETAGI